MSGTPPLSKLVPDPGLFKSHAGPFRHSRESGNPGVVVGGQPPPPRLDSRFRGNDGEMKMTFEYAWYQTE